jgi:hypothetical protein
MRGAFLFDPGGRVALLLGLAAAAAPLPAAADDPAELLAAPARGEGICSTPDAASGSPLQLAALETAPASAPVLRGGDLPNPPEIRSRDGLL